MSAISVPLRPARRWFGLRAAAIVEMAIFFLAVLAVDRFFFAGDRFGTIAPHPFWIIVLLTSVQYGTAEGLLAAVLSTAALLAGNLPEPDLGSDRYRIFLELAQRPICWFVAAVVLGEIRRRQAAREDALRAQLEAATAREAGLLDICTKLGEAKDHLETRVAAQPATVLELCRVAQKLERLDPDLALQGAMDVVRAAVRPRKFSVYVRLGHSLDLAYQQGWTDDDRWSRSISLSSPLASALSDGRRVVCVALPGDTLLLGAEGLIAGSLCDPSTGKMLGMLKIEAWEFEDVYTTRIRTFEAIADWVAAIYAQARLHQSLLGQLASSTVAPTPSDPNRVPSTPSPGGRIP